MPSKLQHACELLQNDQVTEAQGKFLELLRGSRDIAHALNMLGIVEFKQENYDDASALMQASLYVMPNQAEFHHNLAAVYRIVGKFRLAEEHYRRALALKPDYAEAYFNLVAARKFEAGNSDLPEIERQLASGLLSQDDRCFLHFAAGKICDDIGRYDEAFKHYLAANRDKGAQFDFADHRKLLQETRDVFSEAFVREMQAQGHPDARPIFVLGMPRSGSSLVEQILASHPDVHGAGELRDIAAIASEFTKYCDSDASYPGCMKRVQPDAIGGFANAYLKRTASLAGGKPRVVDKMPYNFLHIGLIACLFPHACIVHCRRSELDVSLSNFFQRYRSGGEWSYALDDIARYYVDYEQLMEFWSSNSAIPIFDLDYQTLVEDQETTTRKLLEYCKLAWHDACLKFHKNERPVTTASSWQVRRPMNRKGVHRYRNYEAHLGPLQEALAAARAQAQDTAGK